MNNMTNPTTPTSWSSLLLYGSGEGANSLVMNGLAGFAMLYYTEALGLSPALAGLALSLSVFWEGLTEPAMGHISDRTRSRFGNRHPWMLVGGLMMALCFYLVWAVPEPMRASQNLLFGYLLTVNLLLRTGLTMFFIPYVALGFEVSPSYDGRSRLQGVRQICNMAANFAGPALAWSVFFRDTAGPTGPVLGTSNPANFALMGATFSIAILVLVAVTLLGTRHALRDTRALPPSGDGALRHFLIELKTTVLDHNAVWLFGFTFLVCAGMVLVSSLQMYVYVYFMSFTPEQKSLAHGSTMIGMACGAALSMWAAQRFDKKGTVLLGAGISVAANALLGLIFLPGWVSTGGTGSVVIFVVLHAAYWFGNGLVLPVATAMVGDAAELRRVRTGRNHDGGYAAVFSLALRLAVAASFAASGYILTLIGFEAQTGGGARPAAEVIWRLGAVTLLSGPVLCVAAMLVVMRYPLTRQRF
ncbi:MAG: MFS transporter, partial [Rhizobacter sp.]|nr:MFS transporter [Rhizobacter sp.]